MTNEAPKACPTCDMPWGRCRHTTEGQVTPRPSQRAVAALLGQSPTRPQVADAALLQDPPASTAPAGGADFMLDQICGFCDPKCRELAEYFAGHHELTDRQIDDLSHDIQDAVRQSLHMMESEGQS